MTKKIKRKIMNMIVDALAKKPYFAAVKANWPKLPLPGGMNYPSAFVYWRPSRLGGLTNEEKRGTLFFSVLSFVESNEDLELMKADCADYVEETLMNLLKNDEFRNIPARIEVTNWDPGLLNVADVSTEAAVFPPIGSVRVDGEIEFDYSAF